MTAAPKSHTIQTVAFAQPHSGRWTAYAWCTCDWHDRIHTDRGLEHARRLLPILTKEHQDDVACRIVKGGSP